MPVFPPNGGGGAGATDLAASGEVAGAGLYASLHPGTILPGGGEVSTAGGGSTPAGDPSTWSLRQLEEEYTVPTAEQLFGQYHPAGSPAPAGAGTTRFNSLPGGQPLP